MDLRVIREGQGLVIPIPFPLMLLDVMSEALYQSTVEPFGLPICVGVIGGNQVMPHPSRAHTTSKELEAN